MMNSSCLRAPPSVYKPETDRSEISKILLVLARSWISDFFGPGVGPGPTGFGPWIPGISLKPLLKKITADLLRMIKKLTSELQLKFKNDQQGDLWKPALKEKADLWASHCEKCQSRLNKMNDTLKELEVSIRDPRTARSGDRPVRIGPRFSKYCWSRSGP